MLCVQAVLEGKWPSSSSAYVRWTKIRNAVQAVAQFRRALRSRRLSVYSNSESDFDRMSRGSGDSFLDEVGGDKAEGGGASAVSGDRPSGNGGIVTKAGTEFVNDLINVEGQEERASTGQSFF